jgi:hypothetical protein
LRLSADAVAYVRLRRAVVEAEVVNNTPTEQMYGVNMKVTERTPKPRAAKVTSEESVIDFEERIRCRAYDIYERRGGQDGHDIEDWLQAEVDLAQEQTMVAARIAVKKTRKPAVDSAVKAKAKRVKKPISPAQTKTSEI